MKRLTLYVAIFLVALSAKASDKEVEQTMRRHAIHDGRGILQRWIRMELSA